MCKPSKNKMMRTCAKLLAPAAILGALLFFEATASFAKPEYARKTKKECVFCHPADSYQLTDAGKYYRDHNYSLNGYTPKPKQGSGQRSASSAAAPKK